MVGAELAAGRSPPRADSSTPLLDQFVTLLCAWIDSKGVQRVTAARLGEFYQANPSADRSVLPANQKLEFLCNHAETRGRLRFVPDAAGGYAELVPIDERGPGPVNLRDLREPMARLGDMQEAADHVSMASMNSPPVLATTTGIGDGLTTNLSVGYLQAFLICLRKQKRRAGQGETNCTNYWVKDAQVGEAYYKLKGFKDQDRYKSVKESARVGGYVEIGEAGPGAVKLRLTPLGATVIRQLTDADAVLAD